MHTILLGIKNLLLHKLRSVLTLLGVILGVGSVIAMLAVGEGSKREALEQIRRLGAKNVILRSVKPGQKGAAGSEDASPGSTSYVLEYGLRYSDLDQLVATLPTVDHALPVAGVIKNVQIGQRVLMNARVLGTTPDFLTVKNLRIRRGRFLTDHDLKMGTNIVVLGAGAAQRLFGFMDPLDQIVYIGEDVFRVVGVMCTQDSGSARPGAVGQYDANTDLYVSLTAVRRRFGDLQAIRSSGSRSYERTQLSEITLSVRDPALVSQTAEMARNLLRRSHTRFEDYEVQVPLELLRQAEHEKRIWNIVLGCIAGISLLVGGIGIMNIMLASVTERTREIGIRRALGARRRDITLQFLVETVVLTSIGGILGVILGVAIPLLVTHFSGIGTALSIWAILLAFGISTVIGVVFGLYPARRAAMMNPIEALRHTN